MRCSLCEGSTQAFYREASREFVRCNTCRAVILLPRYYLTPEEEEHRYRLHNNDVRDTAYQKFVSPITDAVKQDFPEGSRGLDYGCGTGPVASVHLETLGYHMNLYDPFFHDNPEVLQEIYDFVICCEVMEHFHNPGQEFRKLSHLLRPGGRLYCKTSIYSDEKVFGSWYYKNDPTHVFFYTRETLTWIYKNLNFSALRLEPGVIVFLK